ncbi:hypothetical protein OG413_17595 [Streptomyces sp. NBC_01433]|uniref:hypothetical protein n=1 Tax=Streptomyces sp. NBC_01433 TaxID=2903864 RepID=UPI002252D794|nr:hypothetical protein [Streptomyces sp. NBC_01433]MCX4677092.1 hypothetical protein [Streptomyces sp. NBC_01433]
MKNQTATSLVERISAIDWQAGECDFTHGASRSRLMREYLHRAALWVQEFQKHADRSIFDVSHSERWPFFDMARSVDPSARPDPDTTARLDAFLFDQASGPLVGKICHAALNWTSLSTASLSKYPNLPAPFEPLIVLFERGGAFWVENGFTDFITHRVRLTTREDHIDSEPLSSLDNENLDSLDEDQ